LLEGQDSTSRYGRTDGGLLNEWTDGWMDGWFKGFVIY